MEKQLFIGEKKPSKEHFVKPQNWEIAKPIGGFWTSTYLGSELGSSWAQWCLEETFGYGEKGAFPSWLVIPSPDVSCYVIETYEDLDILMNKYRRRIHPNIDIYTLDWIKLSKEYDCIQLTEAGQWNTRLTMPYNLYGWDCESTIWLNWKIESIIPLGTQNFILDSEIEGSV
jgi:hypothetical protein